MQLSAAVVSFSPLHRDGRVQRQIECLNSIFTVTALGYSDPGIDGVRFVDVSPRGTGFYGRTVGNCEKIIRAILLKGRFVRNCL